MICVDSSIAVKWVVAEEGSLQALRLLENWLELRETLVAPAHFYAEVTSVLRKRTARHELPLPAIADADSALADLLVAGIEPIDTRPIALRALRLAEELQQPTVYDTLYLALAEREKCEFWTADGPLYRSCRKRFPWVRWIAEAEEV